MPWKFSQRRRVAFSETDLAGIMHFSNFFRWMEETEHAFYRAQGLSVHPLQHKPGGSSVGWPRVSTKCDFHAPLRFEEEADVELLVAEVRSKSIRYRFTIRKLDGTVAAVGEMAVVAVALDPAGGGMKAVAIPEEFRQVIQAAPPEVLAPSHS